MRTDPAGRKDDLWGYVFEDSAADAFLRAITIPFPGNGDNETDGNLGETNSQVEGEKWRGHEAFFIVAPRVADERMSKELKAQFFPDVPWKDEEGRCVLEGQRSFFDCSKAERMLGWVHRDAVE